MARSFKKKEIPPVFDYKEFKVLQRFVNEYGQIEPRKKNGLSEKQQKELARPALLKKLGILLCFLLLHRSIMFKITDLKKDTIYLTSFIFT